MAEERDEDNEKKREREDDMNISEDSYIRKKLFFHIGWAEANNTFHLHFIRKLESQVEMLQSQVGRLEYQVESLKDEIKELRK